MHLQLLLQRGFQPRLWTPGATKQELGWTKPLRWPAHARRREVWFREVHLKTLVHGEDPAAWPRKIALVGKKEKLCWHKKKYIDWMCICSCNFFYTGFQLSLRTINKILFQTHLLTCKCHPVRFSVVSSIGSCTSTSTPKLILRVATRAGKKEKNFVGTKRNRLGDWVCICSCGCFQRGFQFSLRTINKILLQMHLLDCKCHPVRFSVITIIGSCTSTTHPQINFTRVHASWEKVVGNMRNKIHLLCSQWFWKAAQIICTTINKILFKRIFLLNATQVDYAPLIFQVWLSWHELFEETLPN